MKREWLIDIRKSKGLTQQQTAQAAFIDRGYYSQIENGKRNPRHQVAISIANVLNFDPYIFIQEVQHINSGKNREDFQITQHLTFIRRGSLLYLYNDEEYYLNHLITFVLTGIQQKSPCIVIVYNNVRQKLLKRLEALLLVKEKMSLISILAKEEMEAVTIPLNKLSSSFQEILSRSDKINSIRVWLSEEDKGEKLSLLPSVEELYKRFMEHRSMDMLLVHSFSGKLITAGEHINMMRKYPYLMTDLEIIKSPLYVRNEWHISPSLYKTEDC